MGATVIALSVLIKSDETNNPVAADDIAVMNVVINSSKYG